MGVHVAVSTKSTNFKLLWGSLFGVPEAEFPGNRGRFCHVKFCHKIKGLEHILGRSSGTTLFQDVAPAKRPHGPPQLLGFLLLSPDEIWAHQPSAGVDLVYLSFWMGKI